MAGTREGGLKAAATLRARRPNFYAEIGSEGGKKKVPKGYSMDLELASLSGLKASRIRSANQEFEAARTPRRRHIPVTFL